MKCPHCGIAFYGKTKVYNLGMDVVAEWKAAIEVCASCNKFILSLDKTDIKDMGDGTFALGLKTKKILVWPRGNSRPLCPTEVPKVIAEDYTQACLVLVDSPKASAALSRRCLQNILRETAKVKPSDLSKEIQEVLDRNTLPSYIAEAIDAVRNIGNFAAHPMKSKVSGEIADVEPEEAEWNLDVLETLFDFYYVLPAKQLAKKSLLNQKLEELGKPAMK